MTETTILVDGMSCNHCKMTVEKGVRALPGVSSASVNLETKQVAVVFEAPASLEQIRAAIDELGYTPR